MKKIIYFYLQFCPYCRQADKFLEEVISENEEFKKLEIVRINEAKESKIANSYDYYYVPCFWIGDTKVHEGTITKEKVKEILLMALK